MKKNGSYKLSDDLAVKQTHVGALLYSPVDFEEQPDTPAPGASAMVLSDEEMARLLAWYCVEEIDDVSPDGGLVPAIVREVARGEMVERVAVVALRALVRQAVALISERALEGWVMPQGAQE